MNGRTTMIAIGALAAAAVWPAASHAIPDTNTPRAATRVLVLGGQSGDPAGAYARNLLDWTRRFAALMVAEKVPAANITVLAETPDSNAVPRSAESTLVNVRAAFERITGELRSGDLFVLFMAGHGTVTEPVGKFCLPGSDLNANELAKMLDRLPTRNVVMINCASGGAEFVGKCARPGRAIVSATGLAGQGIETVYAEFFLLGLETRKADANRDGRISVLEAFNWSAGECLDWYGRQVGGGGAAGKVASFAVYGKEACRIFRKLYDGSSKVSFNAAGSTPNDPDPPPMAEDAGRRLSTELASIEDRGEPERAASVDVRGKRTLVAGLPGEQGETAAKIFLVHPAEH